MAGINWIKKTVTTVGRPCPMRLGERCPGERSGCAFWISEECSSGTERETIEGCLFAFQYVMGHEHVVEMTRTQATLQQAGNIVAVAVNGAREKRSLNG